MKQLITHPKCSSELPQVPRGVLGRGQKLVVKPKGALTQKRSTSGVTRTDACVVEPSKAFSQHLMSFECLSDKRDDLRHVERRTNMYGTC